MPTLYDLSEEARALYSLKEIAEAAKNDDAQKAINEAFRELHGVVDDKLESCAVIINQWMAEIAHHKAEEKRLAANRKGIENSVLRLKARMLIAMNESGVKTSKGALHTVSLRKTPAKLIIDDPQKIPDAYLVPQPAKPDNNGIKEALKDGEIFDFAHLETGESVSIK